MGGYQSESTGTSFSGNIPAIKNLGGFGYTAKSGDTYVLNLDPPLTEYKEGLHLIVIIDQPSEGGEKLNVDGLGSVQLARIHSGSYFVIEEEELQPNGVYTLVYRGGFFEVITGLEPRFNGQIWKTMGVFHPSGGDTIYFPEGKSGQVLIVGEDALLEDSHEVFENDLLYCRRDTNGSPDDWIIIHTD